MKKVAGLALVVLVSAMLISAAAWAQCGCNTVSREEAKMIGIAAALTWSEAHARFYCSQEGTVLQLTYQGFLVDILITINGQVEVRPPEIQNSLLKAKIYKIRNFVQQIIDQSMVKGEAK